MFVVALLIIASIILLVGVVVLGRQLREDVDAHVHHRGHGRPDDDASQTRPPSSPSEQRGRVDRFSALGDIPGGAKDRRGFSPLR